MPHKHSRPTLRWVRSLLALLLVSLLGLALQACDSDEDDDGLTVGADAPAFTLTASDGSAVSLADYRGQPVLLFFHMAEG